MKFIKLILFIGLLAVILNSSSWNKEQNIEFDRYFTNGTLRVDFLLIGDISSEEFVLKQLKKQKYWAGPQRLSNNSDPDLGNYRFMIYDSTTNKLLYKKGFSPLFYEYQSTEKAKTTKESFYHVNLIPYPKSTIKYVLEKRKYEDGEFLETKELYINPNNYFIINEGCRQHKHTTIQGGDSVNNRIDIAFIAEGYTKKEMKKFREDVKRIWSYIVSVPPFDVYKNSFNVYAIEAISEETGTDNPGEGIYKNTILNSSFYTFNSPRYLTTSDIKSMHDIASIVPYDQLFVVVNSPIYGGGGFFNYYSATTSDNELSLKVAIHEFGHGFAGLADEYYSSDVAYDDGYYNLNVEPWEPNITTLVNFDKKWKSLVSKNVNIPTERSPALLNTIGVYEGGGYSAKGIYSPYQDCRMKSNIPKGFCPVCSMAIKDMIEYYTH